MRAWLSAAVGGCGTARSSRATAREQLELAELAEQVGWDGVFVWEAAYGPDARSMLAAMAARTSVVRLGTMLTPVARVPLGGTRRHGRAHRSRSAPTCSAPTCSGGGLTDQSASAVRSHVSIPAMWTLAQERARSLSRLMIAL